MKDEREDARPATARELVAAEEEPSAAKKVGEEGGEEGGREVDGERSGEGGRG